MTDDLFIKAREAEYIDLLTLMTEEAIAKQKEGANPHQWFWLQSLIRKKVFSPEELDFWWARKEIEKIIAWLFQNYYQRNFFTSTGGFSLDEHEQAYLHI